MVKGLDEAQKEADKIIKNTSATMKIEKGKLLGKMNDGDRYIGGKEKRLDEKMLTVQVL